KDGVYWYSGGFNTKALMAFVLGVIPNVPGFLKQIQVVNEIPGAFETIYSYAWFVGLPLAGLVYYGLMMAKESEEISEIDSGEEFQNV
ncbi:MAG: cytosine permease, partial [Bdellovibrionota bacterium]|nr:cytosine permease [Bdellovibrionota bacterium]